MGSQLHPSSRNQHISAAVADILHSTTIHVPGNSRSNRGRKQLSRGQGRASSNKGNNITINTFNHNRRSFDSDITETKSKFRWKSSSPKGKRSNFRSGGDGIEQNTLDLRDVNINDYNPGPDPWKAFDMLYQSPQFFSEETSVEMEVDTNDTDIDSDDDVDGDVELSSLSNGSETSSIPPATILTAASTIPALKHSRIEPVQPGEHPLFDLTMENSEHQFPSINMIATPFSSLDPSSADSITASQIQPKGHKQKRFKKKSFVSKVNKSFKEFTTLMSNNFGQSLDNIRFNPGPRLTDDKRPNTKKYNLSTETSNEELSRGQAAATELGQPTKRTKRPKNKNFAMKTYIIKEIPTPLLSPTILSLSDSTFDIQKSIINIPKFRPRSSRQNPDFLKVYAIETYMRKKALESINTSNASSTFKGKAWGMAMLQPRRDPIVEPRISMDDYIWVGKNDANRNYNKNDVKGGGVNLKSKNFETKENRNVEINDVNKNGDFGSKFESMTSNESLDLQNTTIMSNNDIDNDHELQSNNKDLINSAENNVMTPRAWAGFHYNQIGSPPSQTGEVEPLDFLTVKEFYRRVTGKNGYRFTIKGWANKRWIGINCYDTV